MTRRPRSRRSGWLLISRDARRMIAPGSGRRSGLGGLEERHVETAVGIALIVIAALEIIWIIRTVGANTPR
jgi:hypothetical protein